MWNIHADSLSLAGSRRCSLSVKISRGWGEDGLPANRGSTATHIHSSIIPTELKSLCCFFFKPFAAGRNTIPAESTWRSKCVCSEQHLSHCALSTPPLWVDTDCRDRRQTQIWDVKSRLCGLDSDRWVSNLYFPLHKYDTRHWHVVPEHKSRSLSMTH